MKDSKFYPQALLMLRCIPSVAKETCFSLKGGTAINFFVRDFPRLSVDIDLAYIPIESREDSLRNGEAALRRIAKDIKKSIGGAKVVESKSATAKFIGKIFVSLGGVQIKIESNPVIRGTVYESQSRDLVPKAED